jgi:CspA family cold shock protein
MATGKVKWFDKKKGYGFLVNPNGGKDIFVHFSDICSEHRFKFLYQDNEVDFDIENTSKGLKAKNVCDNHLHDRRKHFVLKQSYYE